MPTPYLTYACDVPGGHVSAAFPLQGEAYAAVTANLHRQEIGIYRAPLPAADVARLQTLLQQSRFRQLPAPQNMLPDTATVAVGEAGPSEEMPTIRAFRVRDVPAEVQPYLAAARQAVDSVCQKPLRAIEGETQPFAVDFARGEPLSFLVRLQQTGTEPLVLDNPLRTEIPDGLELDLLIERTDPGRPDREVEAARVALTPRNILPLPAGRQDRTPRLTLLPGETITFRLTRRFWLSPGTYRAALVYSSTNNTNQADALEGSLTMDAGLFQVRARA